MNYAVLSLPLIASLSILSGVWVIYLSVENAFKKVDVPLMRREEPDVSKVKEALSAVFPQEKKSPRNRRRC